MVLFVFKECEIIMKIKKRYKHLTYEDRVEIEMLLNRGETFTMISKKIGKSASTISREVKNRLVFVHSGAYGMCYNDCSKRFNCSIKNLCEDCNRPKSTACKNCKICNFRCKFFSKQDCALLHKPPYVCNACDRKHKCTLEKRLYKAKSAHKEYEAILSEERQGINMEASTFKELSELVYNYTSKGLSFYVISNILKPESMLSMSSMYRHIYDKDFKTNPCDLPRKVKFRARKTKPQIKIERNYTKGRNYQSFLAFIQENVDAQIVEIDSVEGTKSGKVLLTVLFRGSGLLLIFLREKNNAASVSSIFETLYRKLGKRSFKKIFQVILTDRGSEFSNPSSIEFDKDGKERTRIYYCDPCRSDQKGRIEQANTLLRRILAKGKSFNQLSNQNVLDIMNNINSYPRKALSGKSPYDLFEEVYGDKLLSKLGLYSIPATDLIISPNLIK